MFRPRQELSRASAQKQASPQESPTIQELLEEREITYRNLLAAFMKVQKLQQENAALLAATTPTAMTREAKDEKQ